jgi:hypothetical protein
MNSDDEVTPRPSPPAASPRLDYAERTKNLAKMKTGEISLDDIRKELKARKRQQPVKLALQVMAAVVALLGAATALVKAFQQGDLIEYRLEQHEKTHEQLDGDLEKLRTRLERNEVHFAGCCPRKGDDR